MFRGRTELSKYGNARLRHIPWMAAQITMRSRATSFSSAIYFRTALSRCLVPKIDGATTTSEWKEALWARFYTGAPQRQRSSVERYSIVKRALDRDDIASNQREPLPLRGGVGVGE